MDSNDPLDQDFKKLKNAVPVPPEFLQDVRRKIAATHEQTEQMDPPHRSPGFLERIVGLFHQNQWAFGSVTVLILFSIATIILWEKDSSSHPSASASPTLAMKGDATVEIIDQEGALAFQKSSEPRQTLRARGLGLADSPDQESKKSTEEIIVTIQLTENDWLMAEAGRPSPAAAADEAASAPLAPEADLSLEVDTAHAQETLDIPVPVIESSLTRAETLRVVEKLAQDFSIALIKEKLAPENKKWESHESQRINIEIPVGLTNDFFMALRNSFKAPEALTATPVPATETQKESSQRMQCIIKPGETEKIQIQIQIAAPQQ